MHYFKFNIGDYHKKAGRLTMIEHGAYTLLLHACYDREQFPTEEEALDWAWARSSEEIAAVKFCLNKFFTLENGRYVQSRIAEEIATYREKSATNRAIAVEREARKRTNRAQDDQDRAPNHKPITKNQEPKEKTLVASLRFEEFWKAYPSDRKQAKKPCMDKWAKLKLDEIADKVISHVESLKGSKSWRDGFCPAPLTYLSQQRWLDGEPEDKTEAFGWK